MCTVGPTSFVKSGVADAAFVLALLTFPLYLFDSGTMQISHVIFFLATIFLAPPLNIKWILSILVICFFVVLREFIGGMNVSNFNAVVNVLYFLFSLLILTLSFYIGANFESEKLARVIVWSTFIPLIFCIGQIVGVIGGPTDRFIASFNSPNQLGYYGVLAASLIYLLSSSKGFDYLAKLGLVVASVLGFLSLSKAAIAALLVIWFAYLNRSSTDVALIRNGLMLVLIILLGSVFLWSETLGILVDVVLSENDSSMDGRGYTIFSAANFWSLIFGFGSYEVHELTGLKEVHSTLGFLFSTYGAVLGLFFCLLFAVWFFAAYKVGGLAVVFGAAIPPMLYGLTHNGFRFTLLWVLIGLTLNLAFASSTDSHCNGRQRTKTSS